MSKKNKRVARRRRPLTGVQVIVGAQHHLSFLNSELCKQMSEEDKTLATSYYYELMTFTQGKPIGVVAPVVMSVVFKVLEELKNCVGVEPPVVEANIEVAKLPPESVAMLLGKTEVKTNESQG